MDSEQDAESSPTHPQGTGGEDFHAGRLEPVLYAGPASRAKPLRGARIHTAGRTLAVGILAAAVLIGIGTIRRRSSEEQRDRRWTPLSAWSEQQVFARTLPRPDGKDLELTVYARPTQKSIFGPYGATSVWIMPEQCRLTELSIGISSLGTYLDIPLGSVGPPFAVRARPVQTEESTMRGPLRGRQVALVFPDRPGLRYEARFPDGSRDRFDAAYEKVIALVGSDIPTEDLSYLDDELPIVTATDPDGSQVWRARAADGLRSIEDADPKIVGDEENPTLIMCRPPSDSSIGSDATPETESAVRATLQTVFGQEAPPDGARTQIDGWTETLAASMTGLRQVGIQAGYSWQVESNVIRMVGSSAWARMDIPGVPLPPMWVELVPREGRWLVSAQSACVVTQFGSTGGNTINC